MFTLECFQSNLKRNLSRFLITSGLAAGGLLFGVFPDFDKPFPHLASHSWVHAQESNNETQEFSNEQIRSFAQVVLDIEPLRQSTYNEIEQIMGSKPVPNIACSQPESRRNLSEKVQEIFTNYCEGAGKIVKNSGLTISEFNEIKMKVQSDPQFKQRVQEALRNLQSNLIQSNPIQSNE